MKKIKVRTEYDKPFWAKEFELMKDRSNLEQDCYDAHNLYDALMTGANSIRLDDKMVGYLGEDGEFELYDDYEVYTAEDLKKVSVEFYGLDRDDDGYTIALFNKVKE